MIKSKKYIEEEIIDLDENIECSEPYCDSRYNIGIKIDRIHKLYFLNIPFQKRLRSRNIYCPKHRESCRNKIYNTIHERANEKWNSIKSDRQYIEYNKIIDSDLFPQFKLSSDIVSGPISKRLQLYFKDITME